MTGVDMETDELSCSDRLVDSMIEQYDEDSLKYVGPNFCTNKEMELRGTRRDPMWIPDSAGVVRKKLIKDDPRVVVGCQFALQFA